jgi:DNA-binding CsgD family transcriptional regulator
VTSLAQLRNTFCATCGESCIHDEKGCVPCRRHQPGIASPQPIAREKPAEAYGRHYPHKFDAEPGLTPTGRKRRARKGLSKLQITIAELCAANVDRKNIAERLGMKIANVRASLQSARDKVGAATNDELFAHVRRLKAQVT